MSSGVYECKFSDVQRDLKLKKMSQADYNGQAVEILTALQRMDSEVRIRHATEPLNTVCTN